MIEVGGSKENNCVWPPGGWDAAHHETGTVFIDSNPAVPAEERIKMIATWGGPSKGSTDGMYTFASADGIRFKPLASTPACMPPVPCHPQMAADGCPLQTPAPTRSRWRGTTTASGSTSPTAGCTCEAATRALTSATSACP